MTATPAGVPPLAVALQASLTPQRLLSYMIATKGRRGDALRLYHWNVQVSAALQEVLAYVEVVLRNAMDAPLETHFGTPTNPWWDAVPLDDRGKQDVEVARSRVKKTITRDRVVAEFSFGFWRFLLASRYEQTLWTPVLQNSFPGLASKRRADVEERVRRIYILRNRIAHHEPIHKEDLASRFDDALTVLEYIDPTIERWVMGWARVPAIIAGRPV